jgi:hypothetical protein
MTDPSCGRGRQRRDLPAAHPPHVQLAAGMSVLIPANAQFDPHARDVELVLTAVECSAWPGIVILYGHDLALGDAVLNSHAAQVWARPHLLVVRSTHLGQAC